MRRKMKVYKARCEGREGRFEKEDEGVNKAKCEGREGRDEHEDDGG